MPGLLVKSGNIGSKRNEITSCHEIKQKNTFYCSLIMFEILSFLSFFTFLNTENIAPQRRNTQKYLEGFQRNRARTIHTLDQHFNWNKCFQYLWKHMLDFEHLKALYTDTTSTWTFSYWKVLIVSLILASSVAFGLSWTQCCSFFHSGN